MNAKTLEAPPPGEPILTLDGIDKRYGTVHAVRGVSLQIPSGSIYGFLGPNGAGKTTTIRSIMNIILPDGGEVLFAGRPLDAGMRDRIGYLPEERGLYRKMRCVDQLAYFAQLKSVPRREALERAGRWLARMGLAEWAERKVDTLSKGMQQKIQFAGTFIYEPLLVILDEPFAGLDPLNIELLREIILEQRQKGATIIFSTHMLAEAEKICDAICLIEGGEKILDGTMQEVRRDFPLKSVRVAYADDREPRADLAGVTDRRLDGDSWRLTLAPEADTQLLLQQLAAHGPVSLFAANRPSLSEIFLTAVRRRRGADYEIPAEVTGAGAARGLEGRS